MPRRRIPRRGLRRFIRPRRYAFPYQLVPEYNRLMRLEAQSALTAAELNRLKELLALKEAEHQEELENQAEEQQEQAKEQQEQADQQLAMALRTASNNNAAHNRNIIIAASTVGGILLILVIVLLVTRKKK